jgi:hypothetical protein
MSRLDRLHHWFKSDGHRTLLSIFLFCLLHLFYWDGNVVEFVRHFLLALVAPELLWLVVILTRGAWGMLLWLRNIEGEW